MPAGVAVDAPDGYVDMCRRSPAACSDRPDPVTPVDKHAVQLAEARVAADADAADMSQSTTGAVTWSAAPTGSGFGSGQPSDHASSNQQHKPRM